MGSRIRCRKTVKKLFECYVVVEAPWAAGGNTNGAQRNLSRSSSDNGLTPKIKSVYPPSFKDADILRSAAQFAFPCPMESENVEVFTFVLTREDSKWVFGYCRHPPKGNSCSIFITHLHWQEIFYRIVNYCAELDEEFLATFLQRLHSIPIPEAGTSLYVPMPSKPFICPCPSDFALPSIPENRNVSEFYNALTPDSMVKLFAALLSERRIVVTSKRLSRLSSIVITSNLFLFPMFWQHIFIPVLPSSLQDYLSAPMPFLIGVPIHVWDRLPSEALGQVVQVDADSDLVNSPFPEDLSSMPEDILSHLKKNLSGERVLGDGLARAFLRALAQLMGHYQDSIREDRTFDEELFIHFAYPAHRNYASKLLRLQIFHQFIEERIERIKSNNFESDEFEMESLAWKSKGHKNGISSGFNQNKKAFKNAGKAVISSVKREGGNVIETIKQNSSLKSAFRSVKEGGKNVKQKGHIAYSDIKSKFHVPNPAGFSVSALRGNRQIMPSSNLRNPGHSSRSIHSSSPTSSSLQLPPLGNGSSSNYSRNSEDNLVHLTSSASASKLPSELLNNNNITMMRDGVQIKPRLSRSEENLIDLDAPTPVSSAPDQFTFDDDIGFTLENPLYELATNNDNVFNDKSDQQLLQEYGLEGFFSKMDLTPGNQAGFNSVNSNGGMGMNDQRLSKLSNVSRNSGTNWTTFE